MDIKSIYKKFDERYKMSHFSRQHFRDIDIKELIYHYKQYECLWNFNSPDYKNKSLKQDAWQDIANYFHKDMNEVKRKIKYLRTAYVAEKKKVDASKKSGIDTPYKPSLFYYNEFDFLDNVVVWRKSANDQECNDLEFESVGIAPEEEEEFLSLTNKEEVNLKHPEIACKVESFVEHPPSPSPHSPKDVYTKVVSSRTLTPRPQKRKYSERIKQNKILKSCSMLYSKENNTHLSNLYTSFGKTISLQLQQLPLEVAVVTMSEIHTILTKKTLEYIKLSNRSDESYSPSESERSFSELFEEALDNS